MSRKIICNVCTRPAYNKGYETCIRCMVIIKKEIDDLLNEKMRQDTIEERQMNKYMYGVLDLSR